MAEPLRVAHAQAPRILVVDDEESLRVTLKQYLSGRGFNVATAEGPGDAMDVLTSGSVDVAVVDRMLSGGESGLDLIKSIKDIHPFCQTILISGYPTFTSAAETLRYETFAYLTKPIELSHIYGVVEEALAQGARKKIVDRSTALFRSIFDSSPNPIVIADLDGHIIFINPSFFSTFGFTGEQVLSTALPCISAADRKKIIDAASRAAEGETVSEFQARGITRAGQERDITVGVSLCRDGHGMPANILIMLRDITEAKKIEEKLIQSEKLSVLGQLAAKLAHEINNPLQIIMGHCEILMDQHGGTSAIGRSLALIRDAALAINKLNADLMEIARPRPMEMSEFTPETPLQKALTFLRRMGEIKYFTIHENYDTENILVSGDCFQLEEVFMNLIMNASHAMAETDEKSIAVKTAYDAGSGMAVISVADTGCGIPRDNADRIFDPFFTTRGGCGGTGLGLAVVKSIVERHGGTTQVESEPGRGTTFTIRLPGIKIVKGET